MNISRALATALVIFSLQATPAFAGAASVVESIKAHVEQNQTRPRQADQRQVTPAPQTALEQWVRTLLNSLARSK